MNNDIERQLRRVTPLGAPPELRARVLTAVADQLDLSAPLPARGWQRRPLAIAACVLAGLALNLWVNDTLERRLTIVVGAPLLPRQAVEMAFEIALITDDATGRWAYERLVASQPDDDRVDGYALRFQRMIQELTVDMK